MHQVKLFNKISNAGLDLLKKDSYEYSEDLTDYDAILVRSAKLHDLEFPKGLKCIARAGAGVNNIPLDRCSEQGIVVFNTPGANANAVKELVLCGLLLSSRDIIGGANWVKTLAGNGDQISALAEKGKSNFAGPEIAGKTLGVIGLGAIGVRVANAAIELGMDVIGYDPYLSVNAALNIQRGVVYTANLNDIFEKSDYITVHVPLMDSTRGIVGEEGIAKMKDGVRILNFARNGLCDEDAVIAIRQGCLLRDRLCFREAAGTAEGNLPAASGCFHAGERGQLCAHGCRGTHRVPRNRYHPQFRQLPESARTA